MKDTKQNAMTKKSLAASTIVLILYCFTSINSSALNYNISFTSSGTNDIDNIIVKNITQNKYIEIQSSSILSLTDSMGTTALYNLDFNTESLNVFPNPVYETATITYQSRTAGDSHIKIWEINGKIIFSKVVKTFIGQNKFSLSLPRGIYTVSLNENGNTYNCKVISQSSNKTSKLKFIENSTSYTTNTSLKVNGINKTLQYAPGDILLFNAYSGNYNSTIVDVISENKTINFNFKRYHGEVTPQKRYLTCGFDDFRSSDISWVAPLFAKYGFKACFNKINNCPPTNSDIENLTSILNNGHEIGDHTILHEMLIYYSPLFNGQDPTKLEGTQIEFPTNNELRDNRGDGKNVFGKNINDIVSIGYLQPNFNYQTPTWIALTDSQCQTIRDHYAVIKNDHIISYLDNLSNEFLGTNGSSLGSWNGTIYTGGIFSGCKTSQNHEIWERILQIQKLWFNKYFGLNQEITEWSLPGSKNGYLYFEKDGLFYYDREKTQLANDFGRMKSSLYTDSDNNSLYRSWIDVLRTFGYKHLHDCLFPGRNDGLYTAEMQYPMIINSSVSKKDAFPYPTPRTIIWGTNNFDETYFTNTTDSLKMMYDDLSMTVFRQSIERLRHTTAQGIIAGCVWDSENSFLEKTYWEMILKFCKLSGIEVITKSEANDIAFNTPITNGNLLYNPNFENKIKVAIPSTVNPFQQPDGWSGDCEVIDSVSPNNSGQILRVNSGSVYTKHYGIPTGNLKFSFYAKGTGSIMLSYIRNSKQANNKPDVIDKIQTIHINCQKFEQNYIDFNVIDEPTINSTLPFEGLDNKICGIYIEVTGDNFELTQPDLRILNSPKQKKRHTSHK